MKSVVILAACAMLAAAAAAQALEPSSPKSEPAAASESEAAPAETPAAEAEETVELTPEQMKAEYDKFAAEVLAGVKAQRGVIALSGTPVQLNISDAYDFYTPFTSQPENPSD